MQIKFKYLSFNIKFKQSKLLEIFAVEMLAWLFTEELAAQHSTGSYVDVMTTTDCMMPPKCG